MTQRVQSIHQGEISPEEFPTLGQTVMFLQSSGERLTGKVLSRISVGDLRSYDVRVGNETHIVSPYQVEGHPEFREPSATSSAKSA